MEKKKPNLLFFVPDTYRADALHHLGNPAAVTPNFDRLITEDAVSFENAFCQNPFCTPSRCSFFSGWYPHVNGHRTLTNMMESYEPVLLETLKSEGYHVWWGGKDDLIPGENSLEPYCDTRHYGGGPNVKNFHRDQFWRSAPGSRDYYSFYVGKTEATHKGVFYDSDWDVIFAAVDFIKNYKGDKPICMFFALGYPHPPYGVEDPWYSMIDRSKVTEPVPRPSDWSKSKLPSMMKGISEKQNLYDYTADEWRELRAVYLGMCARLDHQFGMLRQALEDTKIYDDTAVFIFSDHGDFTGDYGLVEKTQNTFQDCLTRVPMIIKPPKSFDVKPGISPALIELIDFVPTVCEYAGIELDYDHFGMSLQDCVAGKNIHRDAVFSEGGRRHGETQCMELQDSLLIQPDSLYWPKIATQGSEGPEHTKAVMCRTHEYKYVYRLYEDDEFYDLKADPGESVNLIDEPAMQPLITEMRNRTLRFMVETCDTVPRKENRRFREAR